MAYATFNLNRTKSLQPNDTSKFATLISGHTSCLSKDPACKRRPKQPDAGAILEISLRVGVIPLSATTRRVFLTNFLSLHT